jgi:hypothetical protein
MRFSTQSRGIETLDEIKGVMNQGRIHDPEGFEPANDIKIPQGYSGSRATSETGRPVLGR